MERPGTVLADRYRLIKPVGQGGLGAVWEAEHVTLRSRLAIKFMLRTGPRDSTPSQRFLREARIAASVKHRNVLEIIDFGFAETTSDSGATQDVPYMVMELLQGRSLGALIEDGRRLPLARVIDIVGSTLRGLAAVHDAGLVHRDIKPHNVFLVEDEDGAFPKLVDFGLSRRTGRGDLTAEGVVLGTPIYMSPEQAAGGSDLDARVDIYAMGVMLYEMLAGQPPFQGRGVAEVLHQVLHETITPLSELAPTVPRAVVDVIETAMSRDRALRFPDARTMRAALLAAVAAPAEASSRPMPRLTPSDQEARTLPAMTVPKVSLEPPSDTSTPEPSVPARSEGGCLVAVRTIVLAAVAIGVAVLVLEGPWSTAPAAPPDAGAPDDASTPLALAVVDAAGELDASVLDAAIVVDLDANDLDVGIDAYEEDAGPPPEDAAVVELDANDLDAGLDAPEPLVIEDAGTDAFVAPSRAHPRVTHPPRRVHHAPVHVRRRTRTTRRPRRR